MRTWMNARFFYHLEEEVFSLFYRHLTSNQKKSLMHSMRIMAHEFLKSYHYDLRSFDTEEEIENDLYFYWLRNSLFKNYHWCDALNTYTFQKSFYDETNTILKFMYKRHTKGHSILYNQHLSGLK